MSALSVRDCAERRNALKQKPDPLLTEELNSILKNNSSLKLIQTWERVTPELNANGERIIKKSELGETQYVSANYIVRNKTVVSKHIFAGNQRVASTVSMKDNCGTVSEKNMMYFHPDHLGSSSYVTDKKGNFFEMIEYLPYGETLYDEAATVDKTEFRFTSKEMDAETGLYYYGARYYDAKLCKWISTDPILEEYFPTGDKEKDKQLPGMGGAFNPVNLNLYHYAGNNPIVITDPNGKESKQYTADKAIDGKTIFDKYGYKGYWNSRDKVEKTTRGTAGCSAEELSRWMQITNSAISINALKGMFRQAINKEVVDSIINNKSINIGTIFTIEDVAKKTIDAMMYSLPNGSYGTTPSIQIEEILHGKAGELGIGFKGLHIEDIWNIVDAFNKGPSELAKLYENNLKGKTFYGYIREERFDAITEKDYQRLMDECIKRHPEPNKSRH